MKSNLEYIRLFRHADRLDGQDEYYLTTLESAIEFIYKMGPSDLKLDPAVYNSLIKNESIQESNLVDLSSNDSMSINQSEVIPSTAETLQ